MAKKKLTKQKDFVIDIKENAFSSLIHGIDHYLQYHTYRHTTDNLKFAIVHTFNAVELFLKARLAIAHPLLIYTKAEAEINNNAYTVDFKALIGRLNNIGVNFTKDNIEDLKTLQKIRNSLEHHKISEDSEDVELYIGRAAKFLDKYLKSELKIILKRKIPSATYKVLFSSICSYSEKLKKIKDEIEKLISKKKERKYYIEYCSVCGNRTVVIPDPTAKDSSIHCFFCKQKFNQLNCKSCGKPFGFFEGLDTYLYEKHPFCESCKTRMKID